MEKNDVKNVGVAKENSFDNGSKSYNILVKKDEVSKLEGKGDKVMLALVKAENGSGGVTHNVVPASKDIKSDLLVEVSKTEVMKLKETKGEIALEAVQKKEIGHDRANFHVRETKEEGEKNYVGRGWTESQAVKHDYVGNAVRKDFPTGGKAYNLTIDAEKFKEMKPNEYGQVNLSVSKKQNSEDQYSVYKSIGKEPYSDYSISVKKAEIEKMTPHNGQYQLIVADKEKISKDKSDLTVYENTYQRDKKIAEEKGVSVKDLPKGEKNYVGSGWSNKPEHIRITPEDKTKEGLSRAISNNHGMKVHAILKEENVANKSHVKLINEMKEKGVNVDRVMEKEVEKHSLENKQGKSSTMKV